VTPLAARAKDQFGYDFNGMVLLVNDPGHAAPAPLPGRIDAACNAD
jgi:hypothetical protein